MNWDDFDDVEILIKEIQILHSSSLHQKRLSNNSKRSLKSKWFYIYLTGISTINGGSIFSKTDKGLLKSAVPQALICQDPQFHDNFLGTNSSLCLDFIHLCQRYLNHITTPLNTNSQTGILRCFGSIVEIIEVRRYFEEMYNKLTTMNPESFFHFGKKQFRKKIHSDAKYFQNQLLIKSNVNEEQKSNSNSSVQQPQKLSKKQLKNNKKIM